MSKATPLKEEILKKFRGDLTSQEEALVALNEGLVTKWEYDQLVRGRAIITREGILRFLVLPNNSTYDLSPHYLSVDRMEQIKIQHLLGLGDGNTLSRNIDL